MAAAVGVDDSLRFGDSALFVHAGEDEANGYSSTSIFPNGVVVRGLPAGTDPELVKQEFSKFGPIRKVEVMDRIKFSGTHHIYVTFEKNTDARQAILNTDSTAIFGHHCRVHHQQLEPPSKAFVERMLQEEQDCENQKAATLRQMQEEEAKKVEEAEKKKAKKWAPVQTSKPTR